MAISLSSETSKGKIKFTTKIFWNLLGFLLFSLFVFGLLKLYSHSLKSGITETKIAIQEIENKRDKSLESEMKDILETYNKALPLLNSHTSPKKALTFVEKNTYQGVRFSNFSYDIKENSITVDTSSEIASNLLMQLAVFKQAKGVQNVEMGSFSVGEGNVTVQIKIIFNSSLVKF